MFAPNKSTFLDERNIEVWNFVNEQYNVSLKYYHEQTFSCYTKENKSTIYIPNGSRCKDSFTHELLHVLMKVKKVNIGQYLIFNIKRDNILSVVFSDELLEHISNCLDHIKMHPIYLKMGFDKEKFIDDFYTPKCSDKEILLINTFINSKEKHWRLAGDLFMGKYFAINSCPNDTLDHTAFLTSLSKIDKSLFDILERFWGAWLLFNIENIDPIFNIYNDFCDKFIDDLKKWAINKEQF